MSYKTDIEDLIGSVGDDALITSSIQFIGSEILHALPASKLKENAQTRAITSSGLTLESKKILAVHKDSYNAREGSVTNVSRYKDTTSIFASTAKSPVFYIKDAKVYVIGDAASAETSGELVCIPLVPTENGDTAIVASDTGLQNFPEDGRGLIIVGASARCLQRLLSDKTADLPSDVPDLVLPVIPVAPADPVISYDDAGVGSSVAVAQDSIAAAQDAITVGPTNAQGIDDDEAASNATGSPDSAYTKPSIQGSATSLTTVTSDAFGSPGVEPDAWWGTLSDIIEGEEDSELAQLQIQKIRTYIDAFQAEVQSASALMQSTIEDARQSTQASVANASNDTSVYSASIASQTQASIANASNDVNASITKMRESTGAAVAKMVQSTTASIQLMQASTNVNIANKAKTLEALVHDYNLTLSKYSNEIQAFQSEMGSSIQNYGADIQNYSAKIQKHNADYQWKQNQYQQLRAEYLMGLQMITTGQLQPSRAQQN